MQSSLHPWITANAGVGLQASPTTRRRARIPSLPGTTDRVPARRPAKGGPGRCGPTSFVRARRRGLGHLLGRQHLGPDHGARSRGRGPDRHGQRAHLRARQRRRSQLLGERWLRRGAAIQSLAPRVVDLVGRFRAAQRRGPHADVILPLARVEVRSSSRPCWRGLVRAGSGREGCWLRPRQPGHVQPLRRGPSSRGQPARRAVLAPLGSSRSLPLRK
jgi:hypothetical protein